MKEVAIGDGDAASIAVPRFSYDVVCRDANGVEKWGEQMHNLVTVAGKNDLITQYFTASAYTASWFIGLAGIGAISASDTLASHSGWNELTPYSGSRPAIAFGATSGGSNVASAATFSINAAATIAGAFIASASGGTSGILYSAANFNSAQTVSSGDTLSITPTVSVS